MSDYKRLTKWETSKGVKCVKYWQYSQEQIAERLALLEDKIENGTLIELGYHIRKSYRNHDDQRYKIILIDEVEIDKIGYDGLTKAKAEARLKELQEKQE